MPTVAWDSLNPTVTTAPRPLSDLLAVGALTGITAVQVTCDVDLYLGGATRQLYVLRAGEVQILNTSSAGALYLRTVTGTGILRLLMLGVI